ncbi:MAG: sulfatase-like hydrolase/transferase, partial [Acidobacteriota bacterium]
MRKFALYAVLLGLAALVGCSTRSEPQKSSEPSVLIITLDTTRADRMGFLGNKQGLTPNLDAFAKKAYRFSHCESAIPQTFPSHATIFSGWTPNHHGARKNLEVYLSKKVPLLAPAFKKAGYHTAAFISAMVLLNRYGLGRGFQTYNESFYDPRDPSQNRRPAGETLDLAGQWIQGQAGPWFCWVHLYDPHTPYRPPAPFSAKYAKDPYDGEIAYMDQELGYFFQRLEKSGKLKNTLVVIAGDHGEGLGDHGEDTHTLFIYDSTIHVPLLVHLPGETAGRNVTRTVGLVDIAPTVLDYSGLPAWKTDGRSLRPLMSGGKWPSQPLYMESLEGLEDFGWAPLYGLVDDGYKYILAPRPELYDLKTDPDETDNLVKKEPQRASSMRTQLQKIITDTTAVSSKAVAVSNEELESLQSLGYIGGGMGSAKPSASYRDPKDMVGLFEIYTQAIEELQLGDNRQAAALFEKVLARSPNNPITAYSLAVCIEPDQPERAAKLYERAIKARPDFPQPYPKLMMLWLGQGQAQKAFALGRIALQKAPDLTGDVHVLMAWALFNQNNPDADVMKYLDADRKI